MISNIQLPRSGSVFALLFVLCGFCAVMVHGVPVDTKYDVVVYGGTASGIFAAYSAAKQGKKVVLLEPSSHFGGMVTGGLSLTDLGESKTGAYHIVGGYTRKFYIEAAAHYGQTNMSDPANWSNEPHVAEDIYRSWLKSVKVDVHLNERLDEKNGVTKDGAAITQIKTNEKNTWEAKVFIDATYEGDLMAFSGVSNTVGRESEAKYNESLAGVRVDTPKNQFVYNISGTDENGDLLPLINERSMDENGSGDDKVQAYNFRMILTKDKDNKLPWPKPDGYDRDEFVLLANYVQDFEKNKGRAPSIRDFCNIFSIPNGKADCNNNGGFSTDYIGMSWDYPNGDYKLRKKIWDDHLRYIKSFFYFMSSDEVVPQSMRDEFNSWGRAKDEFGSTDNWPPQLYVREARRMLGKYVMTQKDLQTELTKDTSIAMGSYNSDSHNVQRVLKNGYAFNEGDVQVSVEPYEIPYEIVVPPENEASNLIVPVCFSSSHCAFSSIRMEPQYMMIGEAAGVAASLAIDQESKVQDVAVDKLQSILKDNGGVLHVEDGYE